MDMQERRRQQSNQMQGLPGGPGAGGNLDEVRRAGHAHINAVDDAIARTAQGNSVDFLQSVEQEGGQ